MPDARTTRIPITIESSVPTRTAKPTAWMSPHSHRFTAMPTL